MHFRSDGDGLKAKNAKIGQFFDQSRHFVLELGHHFYIFGKPSAVRVDVSPLWGYKMCKGKKLRAILCRFLTFFAYPTLVQTILNHTMTTPNNTWVTRVDAQLDGLS